MTNVAVAGSRVGTASVDGVFQRHTSRRVTTLSGSPAGGRWGAPGTFPVLYLGRPTASGVVEAYRHLVDDVVGMTAAGVAPRTLWTCQVDVTSVLDLRVQVSRDAVGLSLRELTSAVGDYSRCQHVAQAAYQPRLHGIIAPAPDAGRRWRSSSTTSRSTRCRSSCIRGWEQLPVDPRRLRAVGDDS